MIFFISGRLPGLNAVIEANRRNRYAGAETKKNATQSVLLQVRDVQPIHGCCDWYFMWHCSDRRRDPDNIASAVKFVFDGLIAAGVIDNDGWKQVRTITHRFVVDPGNVGVEVEAREIGD